MFLIHFCSNGVACFPISFQERATLCWTSLRLFFSGLESNHIAKLFICLQYYCFNNWVVSEYYFFSTLACYSLIQLFQWLNCVVHIDSLYDGGIFPYFVFIMQVCICVWLGMSVKSIEMISWLFIFMCYIVSLIDIFLIRDNHFICQS